MRLAQSFGVTQAECHAHTPPTNGRRQFFLLAVANFQELVAHDVV